MLMFLKKDAKGKFVSRFARTMMEAGITPDSAISEFEKEIAEGRMSYEVITDKSAQGFSSKIIEYNGYEDSVKQWEAVVNGRGRITKNDIALGQTLYNQAITAGDTTLAMKLASELAMVGTISGQNVQASRMLKKMTPDGQLYYLEKSTQKN